MMTTLQLNSSYVDFWGNFSSGAVARMGDAIERRGCLYPRFAVVPGQGVQTIPSSGKIAYNFRLSPGSLIWGIWPYNLAGLFNQTDLCLGQSLFQDPVGADAMLTLGGSDGSAPSFTLLPSPWPVLGDGLFHLDVWGDPASQAYFLLGVAEMPPC